MSRLLSIALALSPISTTLASSEFVAGDCAVTTDTGSVLLFNELGEPSVSIGDGVLSDPWDVEFGPNGLLYVSSSGSNEILAFDGSGDIKHTITSTGVLNGPRGLTVGANNSLLALTSTNQLAYTDLRTHQVFASFPLPVGMGDPLDIEIDPGGAIWYLSGELPGLVSIGHNGKLLESIPTAGIPADFAILRSYRFAVTFPAQDVIRTIDVISKATIGGLDIGAPNPRAIALAPEIELCYSTGNNLVREGYDVLGDFTWTHGDLLAPTAIAFAPHRFNVKLTGRRHSNFFDPDNPGKIKFPGTLSLGNGHTSAMLWIGNDQDVFGVGAGTGLPLHLSLSGFMVASDSNEFVFKGTGPALVGPMADFNSSAIVRYKRKSKNAEGTTLFPVRLSKPSGKIQLGRWANVVSLKITKPKIINKPPNS